MPTATFGHRKRANSVTVVDQYDVAADAKKRVSLRNSKTKYFHVQALSNGCYLLEPRVLVSPQAVPRRILKMLDQSVVNLKRGLASPPILAIESQPEDQKRGAYQRIKLSSLLVRSHKPGEQESS